MGEETGSRATLGGPFMDKGSLAFALLCLLGAGFFILLPPGPFK